MLASVFGNFSSPGVRASLTIKLDAGDQVVATGRRPAQLDDLVERNGERILSLELDVTDTAAAASAFDGALARFGRIDVVVNNAGYANVAPVESASVEEFRRQFDTNFWGLCNVYKAAVPYSRRRAAARSRSSRRSAAASVALPGSAPTRRRKFAVDGLTRVLAAETAPFGIRHLVVERGGFATDWAGASMEIKRIPDEYQQISGQFVSHVRSGRTSAGDPKRAGEILVRIIKHTRLPSHLLRGAGAARTAIEYSRAQISEATAWQ